MSKKFYSFHEFYPYYLSEHSDVVNRRLHFVGTMLTLFFIVHILATRGWGHVFFIPVLGYGFAWFGHIFFEKNRPATWKHPLYSLFGDFVMFKDMLIGNIKF